MINRRLYVECLSEVYAETFSQIHNWSDKGFVNVLVVLSPWPYHGDPEW